MYVGSVEQTEEKVPIIENNKLVLKNKVFSIGMHKLFGEIVDNSFDELKHLYQLKPTYKGRIIVKIDTSHNLVSVEDNGRGFYKGLDINEKTGLNNIVTAFSQLRAGSNFNNDDEASNLIGTNGVGSSVVNVLSDLFSVETGDGKYKYKHTWAKFETIESVTEQGTFKPGTKVIFIPRFDIFDSLWDLELITTNMIFRNMLKKDDEFISNLDFKFYIDDVLVNLDVPFMPKERLLVKNTNSLKVYTWQTTENSTSVSFVNGSMCTGIHQKMMQEIINDKVFSYDKAHYLYETLIVVNLPPKNVRFGDQNKTKFVSTRNELDSVLQFDIPDKEIKQIKESEWYNIVYNDIENTLKKEEMSKLKKARKNTKKITDKYFPSQKKENLYLVEGNCLHPDTMIKTFNDNVLIDKKIKDIDIGDVVITHTLEEKIILDKFDTIKNECIIKLNNNIILSCSDEHKWLLYNILTDKIEWIKTVDIDKKIHKFIKTI